MSCRALVEVLVVLGGGVVAGAAGFVFGTVVERAEYRDLCFDVQWRLESLNDEAT